MICSVSNCTEDNLKMFSRAWVETLLALDEDLNESVLDDLFERASEQLHIF